MTAKRPGARFKAPDGAAEAFFEAAMLQDTQACIDWPYAQDEGYGAMFVDGRKRRVHAVSCERKHGPCPPDKRDAAHDCGRRICFNGNHLRWATRKENVDDMRDHISIEVFGWERWA